MNIDELKTRLEYITGTDINQVIFELEEEINLNKDKSYPIVLWDQGTLKFTENPRAEGALEKTRYVMNVWVVDYLDTKDPAETTTKHEKWADIHAKFLAYCENLNSHYDDIQIQLEEITGEYYDMGIISSDAEVGIGYADFQIATWCVTTP